MHIYGSVGPFHLMEVPTTRLPNVKTLLHWPSRMYIYCFVEIALYLCTMHLLLIWHVLLELESRHRATSLMLALANINQRCSEGMGIPAPPQGRRSEDIGQHADERKPLFALANDELRAVSEAVVCVSKQQAKSDLRMVGGVRFQSKEGSDVARKRVMAGPTIPYHGPYHCHIHWNLRYGTLLMVPQAKLS